MPYSRIVGTGSYLPDQVLTNQDLAKMVDTTDEWIMQRVGIRERRIVGQSGDTTCSMATVACQRALKAAGMQPKDVEMIVVGTASPDYFFPSAACVLQQQLGIDNDTAAFDVNAACAGFIYGLSVADQFIQTGSVKSALVVGVDTLSTVVDWKDRKTCVLFGDGAGAVVLKADEEPGILSTHLCAAGQYGNLLYAKSTLWDQQEKPVLHMEGREVFRVAVKKLDEVVDQTLQKANVDKSEIDWLIPHQANVRIIQAAAKRLNLPMEKVVLTIEEHGNTSAASIPLALDYAVRNGTVKKGENLFMEGFGAGFAWGGALVKF